MKAYSGQLTNIDWHAYNEEVLRNPFSGICKVCNENMHVALNAVTPIKVRPRRYDQYFLSEIRTWIPERNLLPFDTLIMRS